MYPILKLASKIGNPEPHVTAEFYYLAQGLLKEGDILLSREDLKTINLFIPGFWSHVAIYAGEGKFKETVVEAIGKGVVQTPLVQWILQKDHIAILRFTDATLEHGLKAAKFALAQEGKPYDYQVSPGTQAWYCAELAWGAYKNAMGQCPLKPNIVLGVPSITPQSYWDNTKPTNMLGGNILQIVGLFDGPNS